LAAAARAPGAQLVDDAGKRRAVIDAGSAAVAAWRWRQQRLDGLSQVIVYEGFDGHGGRSSAVSRANTKTRLKVGNTL
jgi:hypothetical protein